MIIVNNDIVVSPISTTAIESTLINNKSIVYAPKYDSRFEPNLITDSCKLISIGMGIGSSTQQELKQRVDRSE